MRRLSIALMSLFAVAPLSARARTKADEEAVQKLPRAFSDAWAKHDGHELAKLVADDADFVTVATTYLHGRSDFEKFHVRLLSGRFKDLTLTPLETARQPRYGMMTLVAEKRGGHWLVVVGQNTNAIPGRPPELEDIKTPIAVPGTGQEP
jgi:hypothetical protein